MDEVTVRTLITRTLELLRANLATAGAALVLLTGAATALDLLLPAASVAVSNIPLAIALICAASIVTRAAMARAGVTIVSDDMRFATMFGIGFLGNLGVVLGLLLLIMPGLYLSARWFVAVPAMFAEDRSSSDSLGVSWRATDQHAWTLVGLTLLLYVPPFALAVVAAAFEEVLSAALVSFSMNLLIYAATLVGWHAAVAAYAALRGSEGRLAEVFA